VTPPRRLLALLALVCGLGLLAADAAAQTKIPLTREQALAEIKSEDVELRRRAAAWLGELGGPADAPALLGVLTDPDEVVRVLAEHSVWQVWSRSGDQDVDGLMQIGVEQMNRGDGAGAVETFTKIIQRKPDFAEAWNKRATVYFLMGENEKSLRDCDEVVKRNPAHFGALAGYGQIYLRLDQPERALDYFRRALRINPNMRGIEEIIPEIEQLLTERRKGTI
jgi:tetratricopeptide (TPR) repeat protein